MHHATDDRGISLKLSEVLREIGVNERMVRIRRKCALLKESLLNLNCIFRNEIRTDYNFGSQSEGTTTIGLDSDIDLLTRFHNFHVMQDRAEWKRGAINLLIVQDEATSPGYCILQLFKRNEPRSETFVLDVMFKKDDKDRVVLKNSFFNPVHSVVGAQINGPAGTIEGRSGFIDKDIVPAFHCDSWPKEGKDWLDRQTVGSWPSMDVKQFAKSKGFLVVAVSSKCNNLNDVEWRISTSMAERLMMFNLNITQVMCYVMMKLIYKTFLTMNGETAITSFMCKCTLFHCIENTCAYFWREDNLFPCLKTCLRVLYDRVLSLNCPHHILPRNNLMAQRINADQQRHLLKVLGCLINSNIDMFYCIELDCLGIRLQKKIATVLRLQSRQMLSQIDIEIAIVGEQLLNLGRQCSGTVVSIFSEVSKLGLPEAASKLVDGIQRVQSQYHTLSDVALESCSLLSPLLCSFVGSLLASFSVYTSNVVSPQAIWWFSAGFESDVSSSRLKLASAFYCANDMNNAELILREIELKYTDGVVPLCSCYMFEKNLECLPTDTFVQLYENNEMLNKITALCVIFFRCEASIIPQELRQELFRSTEVEIQNRSHWDKRWMDFAVVDSLPYLYFLQYKTYKKLGVYQKQQQALSKMLKTTLHGPSLAHRETAWNLLGQCMEQENLPVDALWCYERSLEVRVHNNAANFHKARLLRF